MSSFLPLKTILLPDKNKGIPGPTGPFVRTGIFFVAIKVLFLGVTSSVQKLIAFLQLGGEGTPVAPVPATGPTVVTTSL